jgi:hypothetical protein
MGDHVVHGPLLAQRWLEPLLVLEVFQVADERCALRVHHRPHSVHGYSHALEQGCPPPTRHEG